jgi:hypothetical protein
MRHYGGDRGGFNCGRDGGWEICYGRDLYQTDLHLLLGIGLEGFIDFYLLFVLLFSIL